MPDGPTESKPGAAKFTFITDDRPPIAKAIEWTMANPSPQPRLPGHGWGQGVQTVQNLFASVWCNTGTVVFHYQRGLIAVQQQTGLHCRLAIAQGIVQQIIGTRSIRRISNAP